MTRYNDVLLADQIRQIAMLFTTIMKKPDAFQQADKLHGVTLTKNIVSKPRMQTSDPHEHRYEEHGGQYKLRSWLDGHESTDSGPMHERPEWLSTIINVARIGDHAKQVSEPPPDIIVWFRTNPDYTLHSFIDFSNQ